jgi:hypothetical protein
VKLPGNLEHRHKRTANPFQLTARTASFSGANEAARAARAELVTPRDCVKDFIDGANLKCAGFSSADPDFRSIVVLVWDDFVNEAVNPLVNPESGLFTPNSFAKPSAGGPAGFGAVDAVVVTRHELQLIDVSGHDDPSADYDAFDWFGPRIAKRIGMVVNRRAYLFLRLSSMLSQLPQAINSTIRYGAPTLESFGIATQRSE